MEAIKYGRVMSSREAKLEDILWFTIGGRNINNIIYKDDGKQIENAWTYDNVLKESW